MTRHASAAALALLTVLVAAGDAAAQNPMRPGRWEVTMQMEMPGMPMQMPATKTTQCVTPEQLKEPNSAVPPSGPNNPNNCKVSDYKTAGNSVSWKMACTGQPAMSGSGEMKFDGDTYTGVMKMTTEGREMTMKYSGKRLGDCTPQQ
jgi:hypothetical protein